MELLRVFVALAIPAEVRESLAGAQDRLRRAGADVKWVRPAAIHLTLKFLGETGAGRVPEIAGALARAARGSSPFTLEGRRAGFFPDERRPRVAWVGLAGEVPALLDLQRKVEAACADVGYPADRRAFHAHLTLGRIKSPRRVDRLADALSELTDGTFGEIPVDRIVLYRSELLPQGARYSRLVEQFLEKA